MLADDSRRHRSLRRDVEDRLTSAASRPRGGTRVSRRPPRRRALPACCAYLDVADGRVAGGRILDGSVAGLVLTRLGGRTLESRGYTLSWPSVAGGSVHDHRRESAADRDAGCCR